MESLLGEWRATAQQISAVRVKKRSAVSPSSTVRPGFEAQVQHLCKSNEGSDYSLDESLECLLEGMLDGFACDF